MVRNLLIRGLLVGLVAGLAAFGFARWKGEPSVNKATAFESAVEAQHAAAGSSHDEEVSRSVQDSAGLGAGAILYGVAMGGVFALVFTVAYGRIGLRTARGTAALLGLLGFVGLYLVPLVKYPANPPAVGQDDTIGRRTVLYLTMMLLSVAALVAAVIVRRRLVSRYGEWNATLLVGGGYIVAMAICFLALPGVNEVPQAAIPGVVDAVTDAGLTFPPVVLWNFRVASLGVQVVMWSVIALAFGPLAARLLERPAVSSSVS
ncbi:MAG TPA: CbtA family protein [Acidimicrobiales bacterium]|nr:CbtA family protein [Acidimicrobiales bacterium]